MDCELLRFARTRALTICLLSCKMRLFCSIMVAILYHQKRVTTRFFSGALIGCERGGFLAARFRLFAPAPRTAVCVHLINGVRCERGMRHSGGNSPTVPDALKKKAPLEQEWGPRPFFKNLGGISKMVGNAGLVSSRKLMEIDAEE